MPVPGLSHWDKPLGQAQPFPVGQADWDKMCLSHSLSQVGQAQLVPTGTGKGQKRPFLVPWDKSYTHAGGLSLSQDKFYTHNGACPSSTCPNLSHKVGLQGREIFIATVLDLVRATFFVFSCISGTFKIFCVARLG